MGDEIPDREDIEVDATFTGGEIQFLDRLLKNVYDESIIPTLFGEVPIFEDIREKVKKAKEDVGDRHRKLRDDHDCEEDGHKWGETHYREDKDAVIRGCRYCPVGQYRIVGRDEEWKTLDKASSIEDVEE